MTTNYIDTFIAVAPDCRVVAAVAPPVTAKPTVAALQFELLAEHPYELTSDELLFTVHATRAGIADADLASEQDRFFAKGQPCLRASPLGKRYGWGTHHDEHGRVAIYAVESADYQRLLADDTLTQKAAMRSSRA
ncbi:DUF6157 family protein [Herbiconiux sp. KACC 21604]|uniref:DUF6157 family protein n=1 Tax=unclassified Herbiconiux TaxID=2618217 RepID=UPI001490AC5E|nr:DUF6157 family protein [Herbiconiux sp. SALV-R1]QJU55087.1 hypothetical protein HL652_16675 [Herbiconiux sp. SALV-R1]WPO86233.1 DUF6157 family protein [Herbiconiux sp. KACC 21604]